MIEGAIILLVGMVIGRIFPGRKRKQYKAPEAKPPTCSCKHVYSIHDPETKRCHGGFTDMRRPVNSVGVWDTKCTCRQYDGPVPLPEFYAPEIG